MLFVKGYLAGMGKDAGTMNACIKAAQHPHQNNKENQSAKQVDCYYYWPKTLGIRGAKLNQRRKPCSYSNWTGFEVTKIRSHANQRRLPLPLMSV